MRLLSDNFHRCVFPNFFFAVSVKLQAMIKMVRRIWAAMSWPSRFEDLSSNSPLFSFPK